MKLPPRALAKSIARGEAIADARVLAPLSGRECIAYEIGVRRDDSARARPETWLLLEQRHVALTVGGERVAADAAHLQLERERVEWRDGLQRALCMRGLDANAEGLVLFETVVVAGATMQLAKDRRGAMTLSCGDRARARLRARRSAERS